ncbi:hypothetical protein [Microbacterium sp. LBN7]|uniref:hypothetical protein n=1 Tax=Microbacterium sp. LBN7 TaxID=3129773 RepID=UPI0032505EBF
MAVVAGVSAADPPQLPRERDSGDVEAGGRLDDLGTVGEAIPGARELVERLGSRRLEERAVGDRGVVLASGRAGGGGGIRIVGPEELRAATSALASRFAAASSYA